MKKILSQKVARVLSKKKKLEKELNVKITNRGKEVFIDGNPENEYTAEKVIEAMNFDFPFDIIMLIKSENFSFEILNIKDYTKRHDL